jgi:hypothetical protein
MYPIQSQRAVLTVLMSLNVNTTLICVVILGTVKMVHVAPRDLAVEAFVHLPQFYRSIQCLPGAP